MAAVTSEVAAADEECHSLKGRQLKRGPQDQMILIFFFPNNYGIHILHSINVYLSLLKT